MVAGAGMTGGGTLESDRTLNVVSANDGITVNADNIQLNAVDNLASTSATQPLSANQGKVLDAAKVDKVAGKSLILDTEISRLASVTNQTLSGLGGESLSNKTSILTDSETDYPSGKAVTDEIAQLEQVIHNGLILSAEDFAYGILQVSGNIVWSDSNKTRIATINKYPVKRR